MGFKQIIKKFIDYVSSLRLKTVVFVVLGVGVGVYAGYFFIDRTVNFSYASPTCVGHFSLFPDNEKITDSSGAYSVEHTGRLNIGSLSLASLGVCFVPTSAPKEGTVPVSIAPFGGWFAKKTYRILVPPPPVIRIGDIEGQVPIAKPLAIPLITKDIVFSYSLRLGDKRADCATERETLLCDLKHLGMKQGRQYSLEVIRRFGDGDISTSDSFTISLLPSTRVVKTSITPNDTVYNKPKSISITFDKELSQGGAALYKVKDKKHSLVASSSVIDGKTIIVTSKDELPRESAYEIVVDRVEAIDGSDIESVYKLEFKTSGGPKVKSVSTGSTEIPLGSTIAIRFDQAILSNQAVKEKVSVTGGARYVGKNKNIIYIHLDSLNRCSNFKITIDKGIKNKHDIESTSSWSFSGRMVCHTTQVIGYSSQGRPITAYTFGNGSKTVLYTGAIHGNELGTRTLMYQWITALENNPSRIPSDKKLVIVPAINVDGVARNSRTNARNVDLNRNFATSDWQKDVTDVYNNPFPGGGGRAPMSEPETKAISTLVSRLHPRLILSFHSQGNVVLGNQAGSSSTWAARYSSLTGYSNQTGNSDGTFDYQITGTADDWYGQRLGIPSLNIELSSHSSSDYSRNINALWEVASRA